MRIRILIQTSELFFYYVQYANYNRPAKIKGWGISNCDRWASVLTYHIQKFEFIGKNYWGQAGYLTKVFEEWIK